MVVGFGANQGGGGCCVSVLILLRPMVLNTDAGEQERGEMERRGRCRTKEGCRCLVVVTVVKEGSTLSTFPLLTPPKRV